MKKEIRKEIREFILNDVNLTLARLGVSEKALETNANEYNYGSTLHYEFETPAIKQMPMMFKRTYVDGYMVVVEIKDEKDRFYGWSKDNDIVVVNLNYRWNNFGGGSNGTEIGRIIYAVKKDLPEKFEDWGGMDAREYYVRKVEGLAI